VGCQFDEERNDLSAGGDTYSRYVFARAFHSRAATIAFDANDAVRSASISQLGDSKIEQELAFYRSCCSS
jgi:hypothetical protein